MNLRIYRTWTWELAVPRSEVRFGGDNPMELVVHDQLQYFDSRGSFGPPDESMWFPVPVVEAEKPEHPRDRKEREELKRFQVELQRRFDKVKV